MYLPILRGKQFELIALREMSSLISENINKFSAIIEPVKENTSSLIKTLLEFDNLNIKATVILNPLVGQVITNKQFKQDLIPLITNSKNINVGLYINEDAKPTDCLNLLKKSGDSFEHFTLIHNEENNSSALIEEIKKLSEIEFNIVDEKVLSRGYIRRIDKATKVMLNDHFRVLARNSDYLKKEDEFFSDDHLFYKSEGFIGFSDYLTVGESYLESGFLPYAVAIHITYPDKNDNIRIRHFVSDSNDDTSDVPGKFSEALDKLVKWSTQNHFSTYAIKQFIEYYNSGSYPGLGIVKKLSIMNHIEVVLRLI